MKTHEFVRDADYFNIQTKTYGVLIFREGFGLDVEIVSITHKFMCFHEFFGYF